MPEPIDWASYVDAAGPKLITNVACERGYRREFVEQLRAAGYLGRYAEEPYNGWRAFPVCDPSGSVVAAHLVKKGEKAFAYAPAGTQVRPFVICDLTTAATVHIFESQWDKFAVMDRLRINPGRIPTGTAFVSTRGAANVATLDGCLPGEANVVAWTQSDDQGTRWRDELQTRCLGQGLRFAQLHPPQGYKDFNDVFRTDPDTAHYTQEELERFIRDALESACFVAPTAPGSDEQADADEPDSPPPAFPIQCLPPAARGIIEHGAEVMQVPPVLMAISALGALSAAVGAGIAVEGKPGRKSYANLFLVGAAASGAGKTEAVRLVFEAVSALETELIRAHTEGMAPRASARKAVLVSKAKKLASKAVRSTDEDPDNLDSPEIELAGVQTELQEVEKKLVPPKLLVGDTTTEALGALLAKHGTLTSVSADARDEINNLLGRYRDKGQTDEGLYIKMWSGDLHQVDRIGRPPLRLDNTRMSLFWLVQPDKLHEMVSTEGLWSGGLLPRMLLVETGARMQHMDPDNVATIPEAVTQTWARLVRAILERYRQADHEREAVQPSQDARRVIAGLFNRGVNEVHSGLMRDLESFVARWAEQAWRIALILHVAEHPADAEAHPLTAETASAAVKTVEWFCLQQTRLLARGREEKRRKKLERLTKILEHLPGHEETVRNLRDRHSWDAQELEELVAAYPTHLAIVVRPGGSQGGRTSRRVKLF